MSHSDDELYELVAAEGGRLDAVVAAAIPGLSRTQVQRLIEEGRVELHSENNIYSPGWWNG